MTFGPLEILVIVFIVAMIVGPSRIARMARSLGRGAYDFVDELGSDRKDGSSEQNPAGELEAGERSGESQDRRPERKRGDEPRR